MATLVTKSIGTSSRDYSTITLWEADTDNDLVTADQIQQGECYNDSEFTGDVTISGATVDSTRYRVLTTATGQSFADHADELTNPLRYDQAKGVGINSSVTYSAGAVALTEAFVRVQKLQIKTTAASNSPIASTGGGTDVTYSQLLLDCNAPGRAVLASLDSDGVVKNCAGIQRASGATEALLRTLNSATVSGCTFVVPSDVTAAAQGHRSQYTISVTITNCAFFGVTDIGSTSNVTYANVQTDDNTSLPSGVTNAAYDTTTGSGFEGITDAAMDLRIKSTSALKDAGSTAGDAFDVVGTTRPQGSAYDVGCWEYVSAASGLIGKSLVRSFAITRAASY